MAACFVDAGFVRGQHAGFQRHRVFVHADALRSFVHVEEVSHAVPRAVQVVHAALPNGHTGQHVQLGAARAFGEHGLCQGDVPLQNQGIIFFLFLRQRAEGNGAGDVRGAVQILGARIEQKEAFGFQRDVCFRRSLIVHDGAVRAIACDGIETLAHVERLFGAEGVQFLVYADFRLPALGHGFFQPFQEFGQSHPVALHGASQAGHLHLVAHGFQQGDGRRHVDEAACRRDNLAKRVVGLGVFQPKGGVGCLGKEGLNLFVRVYVYAVGSQVGFQFGICLGWLDEEAGFLFLYQQVTDHHRIAMDVVAPDVERPSYLVQSGEQQGFGSGFLHALADVGQFLVAASAGIFHGMDKGFPFRQGRPVRPNLAERAGNALQTD